MCCSLCQECLETEEQTGLDLVCILNQLAEVKGKMEPQKLSNREKQYLCLWLNGYSNYYIAFRLTKKREPNFQELSNPELKILKRQRNLLADMSKSVHAYVKSLMRLDEAERVPHCSSVIIYLKENNICQKPQLKYELVRRKLYITVKGVQDPQSTIDKILKILRERDINLDSLL